MKDLKKYTIIGIIWGLAAGTLSHFLYDWTKNNYIVGFFTPVNESVWEHIKLLFFPAFVYSLIMIIKFRRKYSCITSALCFGILAGALCIPLLFYAYTYVLGKNFLLLDIGTFFLSTVIAFWLSYRLTLARRLEACTALLCILMCILFAAFIFFTYHPPDMTLFKEQTF